MFFYIEFGLIPMCYSVPLDTMYHSFVEEMIFAVDDVIYKNHDYQDKNSQEFIVSRKERKPH